MFAKDSILIMSMINYQMPIQSAKTMFKRMNKKLFESIGFVKHMILE